MNSEYRFYFFMMMVFVGMEAYAGKEKTYVGPMTQFTQPQAQGPSSLTEESCPFCKKEFPSDPEKAEAVIKRLKVHIIQEHKMSTAIPDHTGNQKLECPLKSCKTGDLKPLSFTRHLNAHCADSRTLYEAHINNCPICIINGASAIGVRLGKGAVPSRNEIRVNEFPTWINHPINCHCDQPINGLKELFFHVSQLHENEKAQIIEDHTRNCPTCIEHEVGVDWFSLKVKEIKKRKESKGRPSDIAFSEEQQQEVEPKPSIPKPVFRPIQVQTIAPMLPQTHNGFQMNVFDESFNVFDENFENGVSEAFPEQHPYLPLTAEEKAELKKQGEEALSKKQP